MNRFGLTIAVPARRAVRRHARPARRAGHRHAPRCAPTTASCSSRTSASSRCARPTCPTYVEAGAADLGIIGKDVLHGAGRARRLRAARPRLRRVPDGPRVGGRRARPGGRGAAPPGRDARGHEVPAASPRAYFEDTGRQAEIVEVKGSVELAPLTGHGRGDRRPHRDRHDAARERPRRCARRSRSATARLIANPVAHKLKAEAIDERAGARACGVSAALTGEPPALRPSARARAAAEDVGADVAARSSQRCATAATPRCASYADALRRRRRAAAGGRRRAGGGARRA